MKNLKQLLVGLMFIFGLYHSALAAAAVNPVGSWTMTDNSTGRARAIINIHQKNGVYSATIAKVFKAPGAKKACPKCQEGLTFMWGVKKLGANNYGGGRILDPITGRVYQVQLSLSPNGKILKVRNYTGVALIGNTQIWKRK